MNERQLPAWPLGLKKTKQRLDVIQALFEAEKPLSAQEIAEKLVLSGNPMWLSTIYRVLETLTGRGVIQKSAVRDSGTALYELGAEHHHYAVCVGCKSVIELAGCPIDSFLPDLKSKSFHIVGHKLQISGYCGDCYVKLRQGT